MATATYSASLCTRKTSSSSNAKSDRACQEFYTDDYNYVGIIHFSGMSLLNKVITGVTLKVTSAQAGYGASHTKTVYLRKSRYQAPARVGITGANYYGDALGTFTGSFYNNTNSYALSGTLLANVAAYLQAGNNTFTIYNPNATASAKGYAENYLQWTAVTITVNYEEAASVPTVSANTVDMGTAVTISTNRASTVATHTLTYSFGSATGTIATSVGDSVSWTPPVSLASQIPNATTGTCTITCSTSVNSTVTGTKTCTLTLSVPASVVPTVSAITCSEANTAVSAYFTVYVQGESKLNVSVSAAGSYGSTITSYRTTVGDATYTSQSFTSGALTKSGSNTITATVTDSRGRTATLTKNISVTAYSKPTIRDVVIERCNADGSAAQRDGSNVRVNAVVKTTGIQSKNVGSCCIQYRLTSSTAWSTSTTEVITLSNYATAINNLVLDETFDPLASYDVQIVLSDKLYAISHMVTISTKQVVLDLLSDGTGIAFGKVAESSGKVEFGWPVEFIEPLPIAQGGTGQTTVAAARNALGLGNTSGALPIANGGTGQKTVAAARNALGLGNTSGAVPVANGGTGATTAAYARTNLGITLANLGAAAASHNHSAANITSGTLDAARLPFKYALGTATINGSSSITVSYASAGFTSVPYVFVTYSTTGSNWSGDNGAIKVHSKTTTSFGVVVGGSFSSNRAVDWFAIGV